VDLCPRFLVPFLRSIFDPFLAFARFAICLFYGAFWISRWVLTSFGPDFGRTFDSTFEPDLSILVSFWDFHSFGPCF
jgi:hypothetical protein